MITLCPGTVFRYPGLNHHFTPSPPSATGDDIHQTLKRQPFNNGKVWPKDSPVAKVYDIGNSSTKLVLYNTRQKKYSRLRGQSEMNGDIVLPDPQRHISNSAKSLRYHQRCFNATSEKFHPSINLNLGWVNSVQRPPVRFEDGSYVNRWRHKSCSISSSEVFDWHRPHRPRTSSSTQSVFPQVNDSNLSLGERQYLHGIAKIYSTDQMKQLKMIQYQQLLYKELLKGYLTPAEYEVYFNYLRFPRRIQPHGHAQNRRIKSAPPSNEPGLNASIECNRPQSRQGKRPLVSARSYATSLGYSQTSSGSRHFPRQFSIKSSKFHTRNNSEPTKKSNNDRIKPTSLANRDGEITEHGVSSLHPSDNKLTSPNSKLETSDSEDEHFSTDEQLQSSDQLDILEEKNDGKNVNHLESNGARLEAEDDQTIMNIRQNLLAMIINNREEEDQVRSSSEDRKQSGTVSLVDSSSDSNKTSVVGEQPSYAQKEGQARPWSRAGRRDHHNKENDNDDAEKETDSQTAKTTVPQSDKTEQDKEDKFVENFIEKETCIYLQSELNQIKPEEREATEYKVEIADPAKNYALTQEDQTEESNGSCVQESPDIFNRESPDQSEKSNKKHLDEEITDLSAEGRNSDIDKIEY